MARGDFPSDPLGNAGSAAAINKGSCWTNNAAAFLKRIPLGLAPRAILLARFIDPLSSETSRVTAVRSSLFPFETKLLNARDKRVSEALNFWPCSRFVARSLSLSPTFPRVIPHSLRARKPGPGGPTNPRKEHRDAALRVRGYVCAKREEKSVCRGGHFNSARDSLAIAAKRAFPFTVARIFMFHVLLESLARNRTRVRVPFYSVVPLLFGTHVRIVRLLDGLPNTVSLARTVIVG